jgi:hypothetical protein
MPFPALPASVAKSRSERSGQGSRSDRRLALDRKRAKAKLVKWGKAGGTPSRGAAAAPPPVRGIKPRKVNFALDFFRKMCEF